MSSDVAAVTALAKPACSTVRSVRSDGKLQHLVAALILGDSVRNGIRASIDNGDLHTGVGRALRISDSTDNSPVRILGGGETSKDQNGERQSDAAARRTLAASGTIAQV